MIARPAADGCLWELYHVGLITSIHHCSTEAVYEYDLLSIYVRVTQHHAAYAFSL